ncbi:MAG: lysylphosphatidylglycerol synthase domain-containing protein [Tepidisphaeraceae bacterium]
MTDIAPPLPLEPPPVRSRKALLFKLLKFALLAAVLVLVVATLRHQWKQIDFNQVTLHPLSITLGMLALFGVSIVQLISYRTLLAAYAKSPQWRVMPTIAWIPPLGKYVPGASIPAAVSMLRRYDIPIAAAVSVVLVLDGLAVLAGLITGAPLLLWEPIRQKAPSAWMLAIPVIAAGALCLHPAVFGRLVNLLLKKLKRPPLPKFPSLREYALPLLCAFGQWLFAGFALFWLIRGVNGTVSLAQMPILIAFAALSQTLGYLMLFAPGGLGVREEILLVGLTPLIGPFAALVVPMRAIAQILIDLFGALVGFIALQLVSRSDRRS